MRESSQCLLCHSWQRLGHLTNTFRIYIALRHWPAQLLCDTNQKLSHHLSKRLSQIRSLLPFRIEQQRTLVPQISGTTWPPLQGFAPRHVHLSTSCPDQTPL